MTKTSLEIILSLKELESFRKLFKNSLFENSYVVSILFQPVIFTRLKCSGKFTHFGEDQNYGEVTALSLNTGRPRTNKLHFSKPNLLVTGE